jgi:hypothetical protein
MGAGLRAPWLSAGPLALLISSAIGWPLQAAPRPKAKPATAPTITRYAIEAVTSSGMGAMAFSGSNMMQMLMGGRPSSASSSRRLDLRLDSPGTAATPTAEHRIPPGLAMGTALPLKSGNDQPQRSGRQDTEIPEAKGRLLIFRGCSESAGAGQPEILSLAGLRPDQRKLALMSALAPGGLHDVGVGPRGTSGSWPQGDEGPAVPMKASLVGDHRVVSNYAPEIRFQVGPAHDFLAPVSLAITSAGGGGAQRLSWQAVPTALGYQAIATGKGRQADDMVIWTSSEAPWADSSVPGDLRVAEAARLVQRKVLLPPESTTCTVSAQAMAAMQTAVVTLTAYGDTLILNSTTGTPAWTLAMERRSTAMRLLGAGMEQLDPGAGRGKDEPRKKEGGFNLFRMF